MKDSGRDSWHFWDSSSLEGDHIKASVWTPRNFWHHQWYKGEENWGWKRGNRRQGLAEREDSKSRQWRNNLFGWAGLSGHHDNDDDDDEWHWHIHLIGWGSLSDDSIFLIRWWHTLPPERTQPKKLCTANFSSGTLKTLIDGPLWLKNKIFWRRPAEKKHFSSLPKARTPLSSG